jgi:hypothetical protein
LARLPAKGPKSIAHVDDRERASPLAQLIHDKTVGNPFFAIQFRSPHPTRDEVQREYDRIWSNKLLPEHGRGGTHRKPIFGRYHICGQ